MNSIGEILRTARERRGKSLDEIASATRINKKFLQQIEADVRPNLPDTYYRAFLRSFAQEVGVDPSTVGAAGISKRPAESAPPFPPPAPARETRDRQPEQEPERFTPPAPQSARSAATESSPASPEQSGSSGPASFGDNEFRPSTPRLNVKGNQTLILLAVVLLAVGALAAVLYWMRKEKNVKPVQEISFADVLRDRESTAVQSDIATADSMLGAHPIAGRDSLILEAATTDSVWVRMAIDTNSSRETVILPHATARWKARYKFNFSIGNAAAIAFTLNGKSLKPVSTSPKPVSNITYSWSTLDSASHSAVKPGSRDSLASTAAAPKISQSGGSHQLVKSGASGTAAHGTKKGEPASKKKKFPTKNGKSAVAKPAGQH